MRALYFTSVLSLVAVSKDLQKKIIIKNANKYKMKYGRGAEEEERGSRERERFTKTREEK